MKRFYMYAVAYGDCSASVELEETDDGEWVRYDDAAARIAELEKELGEARAIVAQQDAAIRRINAGEAIESDELTDHELRQQATIDRLREERDEARAYLSGVIGALTDAGSIPCGDYATAADGVRALTAERDEARKELEKIKRFSRAESDVLLRECQAAELECATLCERVSELERMLTWRPITEPGTPEDGPIEFLWPNAAEISHGKWLKDANAWASGVGAMAKADVRRRFTHWRPVVLQEVGT